MTHPCGWWPPAQHISQYTPLAPVGHHCSSCLKPCRARSACQGLPPRRRTVPPPQLCWQGRQWGVPAHPQLLPTPEPLGPPTWWSRLQGCPVTTDQAQRRLQIPSRQAGAIWLQETAGQKNKSQSEQGSWRSRPCRARCGHSHTARGPRRAPAPQPHGPADHQHLRASVGTATAWRSPAGCAWVKGGSTSYTLTTVPRHLSPAACHGGQPGTASTHLADPGVP